MNGSTAQSQDLMRCPRCGASVAVPDTGYCTCCGSALGMSGRTLGGARAPLRMSPGLGQEALRTNERPVRSEKDTTERGFVVVRQHGEFPRWMQEAPTGLAHVLGMAGVVALGLVFTIMALTGTIHAKRSGDSGPIVALFVCTGIAIAAFGAWRLVCFYRAPRLNRPARVTEERERTTRTKHGWRTRHYATFEFEDGGRSEFQISSDLASQLTRGDCGVAITRDTVLLAFHWAGRH